MLYCSDCQRLAIDNCPLCGRKARKLRVPEVNDPVLIYTGDFIHSSMVEPLLDDNKLPYSKIGTLGAGLAMKTGSFLETFKFYVPYGAYEEAVRLITSVFGNDKEIMDDLVTIGMDVQSDVARVEEQYVSSERHDARRYLHSRFTVAETPFYDWELDNMRLESGMRILDIGCGSGDIWAYRPLPDNLDITLADQSQGMIDAAKERTANISNAKFTYLTADACYLPFDAKFDMVLAAHMLYHVPDLPKAISEIARVLVPGGRLCATTISQSNLKELYDLCAEYGVTLTPPPTSFSRESGERVLSEEFDNIELIDHVSMLRITEAQPLIDYVSSYDTFSSQNAEALGEMKKAVQTQIDVNGSYNISKLACMFVCKKQA